MPQLNVGPAPIYLGDPVQGIESLRQNANKNRDWRDGLNSIFGNDPLKRPDAIDWKKRFDEGLIENGVVKVTAGDALIGRSQPELQLAYETWRQKGLQRQAIPLNADLRAEGRSPVKIDTDTNSSTLEADALQLEKVVQNRDILLGMDKGPAAYAALGDNPTSSQILGAISATQAAIDAPGLKREKELFDDDIKTNKSARAANTAATELAQSRFNLEETNSAENQNFREWQAQDQSAYRKFQEAEQTRRLQYDNENRNSDRNLQMQLAEMNRDERGEVRREERRRDAKKDRQLMLLQLINGLKEVGQGFGG
jgi:hypothetical protein